MFANFSKEGQIVMEGINCTPESLISISIILALHEGKTVLLFDRENEPNVCALALEGKIEQETIQKNESYSVDDRFDVIWCPANEEPAKIPIGKDWTITALE